MACTGIEFCKLAIVDTKDRARDLVAELERRFPDLDVPITVNVNGCPNACARTQVADIGLKGQLVMDGDRQVEGFQVHLGGATGLQANFGRKLRAHKVTSAGLDDYVTAVVTHFLADRADDESFATWVARADEELLRGEQDPGGERRAMSERAVPFHCPYCGEQDLRPHEESPTATWECRGCLRAFSLKLIGLIRPTGGRPMTTVTTAQARSFRGTHTEGRSSEELRELVSHVGAELELAPAEDIVEWAVATFGKRFCITSSMGDAVLAHVASRVAPGVDVVFLDTGYHFAETIGTADAVGATMDVNLIPITPVQTVAEQDAEYGPELYKRDPDLCCAAPQGAAAAGARSQAYDAWATGLRRAETHNRVIAPVVGWDARKGKVKVSPLARWSDDDVERYIARARRTREPAGVRRLPVHRLRAVHPPRRPRRGPAQRPLGRHRQDRVRDPLMTRPLQTPITIDSAVGCSTPKMNNERRPL